MPIKERDLQDLLEEHFAGAKVEVQDLAGDDDHYRVTITSPVFAEKSRIEQHKMVQDAVKDRNIHALSIKTMSQ